MNSRLLRTSLVANAAFSGLSGLDFILFAPVLSEWIGGIPPVALRAVGLVLLVFAVSLVRNARRTAIDLKEARLVIWSDWGWVIGSAALLIVKPVPLTSIGQAMIIGIALVVATFAILQQVGVRRLQEAPSTS